MSTVRSLNCIKDKDVILQYYSSCRQTVAAALWKHHSCNTLPSHHHLRSALPPFICLSVTVLWHYCSRDSANRSTRQ